MIEVKNVKVGYGTKDVLHDLNIEFLPREIHGILGVNGAGKTTLFRSIFGLLPLKSGSISLNEGAPIKGNISFLETKPNFYPYMTGKEYLDLLRKNNDAFNVEDWNSILELPLNSYVTEYSTGMKKKVAFLGMIAMDKPIIILDEPFNGVDIESNEKLLQIIHRLKMSGKTLILSSHLLQALIGVCDKISLLSNGHIEQTFLPEEFTTLQEQIQQDVHGKINVQLEKIFKPSK